MRRGRMLSNDDGSLLQIRINFIRKDCDTIVPAISVPPMVHVCPRPTRLTTLQCSTHISRPMGGLFGKELDLSAWWHQGIDSKDRNGVFSPLLSQIGADSKNLVSANQPTRIRFCTHRLILSFHLTIWPLFLKIQKENKINVQAKGLLIAGSGSGWSLPQEITCLWTIWICASAHFSRADRPQCTQAACNYHFGVRSSTTFPRALTPSMLSEQLSVADNANDNGK